MTKIHNLGATNKAATAGAFLYISNKQGRLSKQAYAAKDGSITLDGGTNLCRGTAKRTRIPDDPDAAAKMFAQGINQMKPSGAIALGDHLKAEDVVGIVTARELSKRGTKRGKGRRPVIARNREHITYRPGRAAWSLLDIDAKNLPEGMLSGDVWAAICKVAPGIENTARVTRPSASSGITNAETGEKLKGGGLHIFLLVKDGADIDRATLALDKRLWLADHGNIVLSADGKMLMRSPIDIAVRFPERLVYEGAVECVSPIEVDPNARVAVAEGAVLLDTRKAVPDLSKAEEEVYLRLVADAKRAAQVDSETRREDYISRSAGELVKTQGVSLDEAREAVASRTAGLLLPADTIVFAVQGEVSVADVMATPNKYDGAACADPVEGPAYGTTTAKFYANADTNNPLVNSKAHGGAMYHFRDPAADFDDAAGQGGPIPDWVVEENSRGCHGMYGTQDVVFTLNDGGMGYQFTKAAAYKSFHKNMRTVIKGGERKCCVKLWLEHPARARAEQGLITRSDLPPGRTPDGYFNVWFGLVEAKEGDWSKLKAHILNIICDGVQTLFDYLLNWIAWGFQNPTKQIGVCIVLQGGQGTGKSLLGRAIRHIYGSHSLYTNNPKHLVGDFNSQLRDTAFVEADEAIYAGDHRQAARLKSLITEPTLDIEEKGLPVVNLPNMLKIMMATNETWAVPVGHDDRRFVVFEVSDKRQQDHGYFAPIFAECKAGGNAAMLFDLLQRDVSGFNPERDRPDTKAHADQKRLSLPPIEAWLAERLEAGDFPHPDGFGCILDGSKRKGESDQDAWARGPIEVSSRHIAEAANEWCRKHHPRAHRGVTAYDVRKVLEPYLDLNSPAYVGNKRGSRNGGRVRYLTLRSHAECFAIGCKRLGLDKDATPTSAGGGEAEIDPFS